MTQTWFKKVDRPWLYLVTQATAFDVESLNLPNMQVYSLKGKLIAIVNTGMLVIYQGYSWDGCTAIGRIIETAGTLRASLLHDFLYQLAEQPDYQVTYTQRQADLSFLHYLPLWAKPLWYTGVRLCGWVFFGDIDKSLNIKFV